MEEATGTVVLRDDKETMAEAGADWSAFGAGEAGAGVADQWDRIASHTKMPKERTVNITDLGNLAASGLLNIAALVLIFGIVAIAGLYWAKRQYWSATQFRLFELAGILFLATGFLYAVSVVSKSTTREAQTRLQTPPAAARPAQTRPPRPRQRQQDTFTDPDPSKIMRGRIQQNGSIQTTLK